MMTNKWYNIDKHSPDPKEGLTEEGDRILVYGNGYGLLYEVVDGVLSVDVPENFKITHWKIEKLPEEE